MGWKIPVLLAALLGAMWICASAETERDPRQTPPPGRALPPAPELSEGSTVSAPAPDAAVVTDSSTAVNAAAKPVLHPGGIKLPPLPTVEKPRASSREGAARRMAASALALTRAGKTDAVAEQLRVAPGRLVKDPALRRKLDELRNASLGMPAPVSTLAAGPAAALPSPLASALSGPPMLDLSANFALPDSGDDETAAFGKVSDPYAAPVDLVLPAPPPHMPLPAVRTSVTELARGNPKLKRIALTFDDGPHPEFTSQLLAILSYYRIPATFMVVGVQAQKNPQWVKMIAQSGNEIANHSYDHFRMPALPLEEKVYQIDENQRLLEQLTGITPRFFRPPGGRCDDEVVRLLCQRGMVLALWDVAVNDTAEDREAVDLGKTAAKEIRPGSIVLMHDGIQGTVEMLPGLIESLQKQGYDFVTLSELAAGL